MAMNPTDVLFEGVHVKLVIRRPAPHVTVVILSGTDIGELKGRPFQELNKDLVGQGRLELFIDARHVQTATVDVSGEWAIWLQANRARFRHVSMLTGSRFIQMSAEFVRKFAGLEDAMRLYTDPATFDGALAHSIANALSA